MSQPRAKATFLPLWPNLLRCPFAAFLDFYPAPLYWVEHGGPEHAGEIGIVRCRGGSLAIRFHQCRSVAKHGLVLTEHAVDNQFVAGVMR
jgi:hypothetical protein